MVRATVHMLYLLHLARPVQGFQHLAVDTDWRELSSARAVEGLRSNYSGPVREALDSGIEFAIVSILPRTGTSLRSSLQTLQRGFTCPLCHAHGRVVIEGSTYRVYSGEGEC